MKEKLLYSVKYRKGSMSIKKEKLPFLPHLAEGFECFQAFLQEAGSVRLDGEEVEYQVLRCYLREVPDATPTQP